MNIHIKDIKLFEELKNSTLVNIEVGSKMYGLIHQNSDIDMLYIYATSDIELNSFYMSHEQLQYKGINKDYIFTNIHVFLRNALNGDSTINFETINSKKLIGTSLEFLYDLRKEFYNYKILRSYLGMAKRDIKRVNIDGKNDFDKNKKIAHAYRGLMFAKKVYFKNEILLSKNEIKEIKENIWLLKDYNDRENYCNILMENIDSFRKMINIELNNGKIIKFMSINSQKKIRFRII
jgi:predicted nucleotidyltransferase